MTKATNVKTVSIKVVNLTDPTDRGRWIDIDINAETALEIMREAKTWDDVLKLLDQYVPEGHGLVTYSIQYAYGEEGRR